MYASLPLVIQGHHFLSNTLTYTAYAGYDSGRKVTTFYAGLNGVGSNEHEEESEPGQGPYYGVDVADASGAVLHSTLFVGVRPKVVPKFDLPS